FIMDIQSASSVVLQALTQATSQDTAVLKPVEEQLRQWETQPGFCSVLLGITVCRAGVNMKLRCRFGVKRRSAFVLLSIKVRILIMV
ncbi:hypothetical protein cypCar_00025906, partial [Cyprinus carpio]